MLSGVISEERGSRYTGASVIAEQDKLLEVAEDGGQTVILRGG